MGVSLSVRQGVPALELVSGVGREGRTGEIGILIIPTDGAVSIIVLAVVDMVCNGDEHIVPHDIEFHITAVDPSAVLVEERGRCLRIAEGQVRFGQGSVDELFLVLRIGDPVVDTVHELILDIRDLHIDSGVVIAYRVAIGRLAVGTGPVVEGDGVLLGSGLGVDQRVG